MGSNGPTTNKSSKSWRSAGRVKSCMRTFLAHLFSHIGLCLLIVGYAIVGAALFEWLESQHEIEQRDHKHRNWTATFQQIRQQYVDELWNITDQFNVLYQPNWTLAVDLELRKFETIVAAAAKKDGYDIRSSETERQWSFSGALLYSVSIITTIGYGNTAPRTAAGKILTMLYAVIGVPLMLLWLSNIGTLMANTFKFAYSHVCCSSSPPSHGDLKSSKSVRSVQKPTSKETTLATQVKYSVIDMTCETHVVQTSRAGRPGTMTRASLQALDPAAKQVLLECAEYNVAMTPQDNKSRRIVQQLSGDSNGEDMDSSSDVDSVIDISATARAAAAASHAAECGMSIPLSANGGRMSYLTTFPNVEGTPSKVPLLIQESGPDLVDVEGICEDPLSRGNNLHSTASTPDNNTGTTRQERVPITLVLIFVVLYIMGGAMVFSVWEEWNFLESAYFCFITLSTIGLGDYVPGRSLRGAGEKEGHAQLIVCCLYLVLGLAIIAMSFNLVQEEVATKVKDIARRIGILKDSRNAP